MKLVIGSAQQFTKCSELTEPQTIAKHVMNIHMNKEADTEVEGEIDIERMKRYISYAKS